MALSESRRRANEKYNAKAYDQLLIRVKKGKKEIIQQYAQNKGESLNGFVNRVIDEAIEQGR